MKYTHTYITKFNLLLYIWHRHLIIQSSSSEQLITYVLLSIMATGSEHVVGTRSAGFNFGISVLRLFLTVFRIMILMSGLPHDIIVKLLHSLLASNNKNRSVSFFSYAFFQSGIVLTFLFNWSSVCLLLTMHASINSDNIYFK